MDSVVATQAIPSTPAVRALFRTSSMGEPNTSRSTWAWVSNHIGHASFLNFGDGFVNNVPMKFSSASLS